MNVGIRSAAGRYIYLSEDDVVLRPGCIAALARFVPEYWPLASLVIRKTLGL